MAKLLIVDDDFALYGLLRDYLEGLEGDGFECGHAADAESGLRRLAGEAWDAAVLDVMLPGMDGFEVLRRLRESAGTRRLPVLMLTARGEEEDKVAGLELGADDYLAKPFGVRELVARLRALLRRAGDAAEPGDESDLLRLGDLTVHRQALRVEGPDGAEIAVSYSELRLLEALAATPGEVVDRERLYRAVFDHGARAYDRSLDMLVSRLRKKLGPAPGGGERIRAVWGEGYVYVLSGAEK